MIRTLMMLGGVMAMVVLMVQAALAGWLWVDGRFSESNVRQLQLLLAGPPDTAIFAEEEAAAEKAEVGQAEVREARILRILDLQAREKELAILKALTTDAANQLILERKAFDQLRESFRTEVQQMRATAQDAAREQARAVLLASKPEDAMSRLMGLDLPEAVELVRGMPEKSIAKILAQFTGEPDRVDRGQKIFEAIDKGEPLQSFLKQAESELGSEGNG